MGIELLWWDFLLAILTKFGFMMTIFSVGLNVPRPEFPFTMLAGHLLVELFFMFISIIDIIHFSTFITAFDIPSTVSKMSSYFGFREHLQTVVAFLHFFRHLKIFSKLIIASSNC